MREKNRKPIASIKKLPQFTTMNVIDGQAGLISYFSLIFYSLTIDNILTIVILIILATVTINFAFGEDGIIARAQQAKEITEQATRNEQESLNSLMEQFNEIMSGEGGETPEEPEEPENPIEEIKGQIQEDTLKVEEVPIDSDGDNPDETGTIYIPGGFGIDEESPNDINDGIVISNVDDTKQFVWIPVSEEELGEMYFEAPGTVLSSNVEEEFEITVTTDVYSKLRDWQTGEIMDTNTYKPGTGESYSEPDILTDTDDTYGGDASSSNLAIIKSVFSTELAEYGINSGSSDAQVLNAWAQMLVDEYNETYESIKKYGGFYIGRYEISGSVESPTVVKGGTVLDASVAGNWYNLKKASNNVVNNEYVKSEMIYGNQWDRVMNWLVETGAKTQEEVYINSSSWGNYLNSTDAAATDSGSKQTSGKNEAWQANNIYDLAGNYYDWTQEAYDTVHRIGRGRCLQQFRFSRSSFLPQQRRSRRFLQLYFLAPSFVRQVKLRVPRWHEQFHNQI